jgi:hypothetical protein
MDLHGIFHQTHPILPNPQVVMSLSTSISMSQKLGPADEVDEVRFCKPCMEFRKYAYQRGRDEAVKHHPIAASFQQALEYECVICVRLWAALERTATERPQKKKLGMTRTNYRRANGKGDFFLGSIITFLFTCGSYEARLEFRPSQGKIRSPLKSLL